jgi:TolB protein
VSNGGGINWPHTWTPNGRVVFHTNQGSHRTRLVHPDDTDLQPMFDDPTAQYPHWSPEGSHIAFVSERNGNPDIFIIMADGSGLRSVTDAPGRDVFNG